ncbi:sulfotransferase family protein [Sphaerisporangium fuscum]|uniref:sulfotransferase family protein n=1 Tax=Sphaerisporangium fuscum TaxID=2835868 RepID=UPI001BDC849D|nr:sulfotransferase family protein [Sphaerisporangium fuscum]
MLRVIGAGFPRTGTTSLKAALDRLGFGPCHHMVEVLMRPEQAERWLPVLSDGPTDWEQVLEGYQSAVDWPGSFFWRELADAYPDAKVILTVRDPHRWYASFCNLLDRPQVSPGAPGAGDPAMETMMRFRPVMDLIGRSTFGDSWSFGESLPGEEHAVEVFRRHIETVKESLPAERLLVFQASQGWEPLCEFLGVEPPKDEPYPHLNDSESLRRNRERVMRGEPMVSPFDTAS